LEVEKMTTPSSIFSHRTNYIDLEDEPDRLQFYSGIEDGEHPSTDKGILARMLLESQQTAAAATEPVRDFSQRTLSELIQYIVRTHHDFIREEMPRLHELSERVIATRKWQNAELIELARKLRRLSGDLTFHMSHCENKVFPYIEALERSKRDGRPLAPQSTEQAESLIEEVMVGHSPAGEMLKQMEADTRGFAPPEDACPDMISLYEGLKELARRRSNHIQLEGYILFPRALALEKEVLAA
jgi:regulator of cell morphogenesis and NO signaling